MDIRHTATTCPYCGCGCGLTLETAEGRIQRSVPMPDSPVNRGKLCNGPQGIAYCDVYRLVVGGAA